jgi:hypothetical protein
MFDSPRLLRYLFFRIQPADERPLAREISVDSLAQLAGTVPHFKRPARRRSDLRDIMNFFALADRTTGIIE